MNGIPWVRIGLAALAVFVLAPAAAWAEPGSAARERRLAADGPGPANGWGTDAIRTAAADPRCPGARPWCLGDPVAGEPAEKVKECDGAACVSAESGR